MVVLITLGLILLVCLWLGKRQQRKWREGFVVEFQKLFPERCLICSMHEYGIIHGIIGYEEPYPKHECIERKEDEK